jgi:hypothetical protein
VANPWNPAIAHDPDCAYAAAAGGSLPNCGRVHTPAVGPFGPTLALTDAAFPAHTLSFRALRHPRHRTRSRSCFAFCGVRAPWARRRPLRPTEASVLACISKVSVLAKMRRACRRLREARHESRRMEIRSITGTPTRGLLGAVGRSTVGVHVAVVRLRQRQSSGSRLRRRPRRSESDTRLFILEARVILCIRKVGVRRSVQRGPAANDHPHVAQSISHRLRSHSSKVRA